jgi:hypothetical protein
MKLEGADRRKLERAKEGASGEDTDSRYTLPGYASTPLALRQELPGVPRQDTHIIKEA